jgi:hypothetical protein
MPDFSINVDKILNSLLNTGHFMKSEFITSATIKIIVSRHDTVQSGRSLKRFIGKY